MTMLNLKKVDLFADATDEKEADLGINRDKLIHIRVLQRNTKKRVTTCEGLPDGVNINKIVRALKKNFHCSASVENNKEHGPVIKIQGQHVDNVVAFLIETQLGLQTQIRIHGD